MNLPESKIKDSNVSMAPNISKSLHFPLNAVYVDSTQPDLPA